jgi:hypothetical protein
MATFQNTVDAGKKEFSMSMLVPTKGLKPGQTAHRHFSVEDVISAAKVSDVDILNPTSIDVEAVGMKNSGVTVIHSMRGEINPITQLREPHILATNDTVYHSDLDDRGRPHETPELFHALGLGEMVRSTSLDVIPSRDQMAAQKKSIEKKIDRRWQGYSQKNVLAGVTQARANVDGEPTHFLVTEHDHNTGEKSAVWNLLEINRDNNKLWNGAYNSAKLDKQKYEYNGKTARLMSSAHIQESVVALTKSLKTHSPFVKGLGVMVTNKGNTVAAVDTTVMLTVHRTPLHPITGIVPKDEPVELSTDLVSGWNGLKVKGASAIPVMPSAAAMAGFGGKRERERERGGGGMDCVHTADVFHLPTQVTCRRN